MQYISGKEDGDYQERKIQALVVIHTDRTEFKVQLKEIPFSKWINDNLRDISR